MARSRSRKAATNLRHVSVEARARPRRPGSPPRRRTPADCRQRCCRGSPAECACYLRRYHRHSDRQAVGEWLGQRHDVRHRAAAFEGEGPSGAEGRLHLVEDQQARRSHRRGGAAPADTRPRRAAPRSRPAPARRSWPPHRPEPSVPPRDRRRVSARSRPATGAKEARCFASPVTERAPKVRP